MKENSEFGEIEDSDPKEVDEILNGNIETIYNRLAYILKNYQEPLTYMVPSAEFLFSRKDDLNPFPVLSTINNFRNWMAQLFKNVLELNDLESRFYFMIADDLPDRKIVREVIFDVLGGRNVLQSYIKQFFTFNERLETLELTDDKGVLILLKHIHLICSQFSNALSEALDLNRLRSKRFEIFLNNEEDSTIESSDNLVEESDFSV